MLPYPWSQNRPEEKGVVTRIPSTSSATCLLPSPTQGPQAPGPQLQTWREGPERCQLKATQQAGLGASHQPAALGALRLRGLPWPVSLPGCPTVCGG